MKRTFFFASVVLLVLAGCSTSPTVVTDYDTGYEFAQLKTFQVESTRQDDDKNLLISPFTLSHLKRVIEDNLAERYAPATESQTPDFVVRYHLVVEDRLDVRSYDQRYGFGYYGYGPFYRYPYVVQPSPKIYRQGSLIVDVARGEDDKPLWRGVSEQRLYESLTPQEQRQRLSSSVAEILAKFPPVK